MIQRNEKDDRRWAIECAQRHFTGTVAPEQVIGCAEKILAFINAAASEALAECQTK